MNSFADNSQSQIDAQDFKHDAIQEVNPMDLCHLLEKIQKLPYFKMYNNC